MGLLDPFVDLFYKFAAGKTASQIAREQRQADETLAELNRKKLEAGTWDRETFNDAEIRRVASNIDPYGEYWTAMQEGAAEGLRAEGEFVKKTVGAVGSVGETLLGGLLRGIPWWVWLGGAIYLLWRFGVIKIGKAA
jgi:hypothetical protein